MRLVIVSIIVAAALFAGFAISSGEEVSSSTREARRIGAAISQDNAAQRANLRPRENNPDYRLSRADTERTPPNRWRISQYTSAIDGSPSVEIYREAVSSMTLRFGRRVTPELRLRCIENTTSLIITVGDEFIHNEAVTVEYRLDDGPVRRDEWRTSTSYSSFGLWRGGRSIPLIRQLATSDQLVLRFTPYGEDRHTVTFNLDGLEARLPALREACNW